MQEALKSGNAALRRDPRGAPYGLLVNGEFLHEDLQAFMWFDSPTGLASHLREVQHLLLLRIPGSEAIESFREQVRLPLEQLLLHGFRDDIRHAFNLAADGLMTIEWWGKFTELCVGETRMSCEVLTWFRVARPASARGTHALTPEELEPFVRFVRTW
jgi:hypothetical protein